MTKSKLIILPNLINEKLDAKMYLPKIVEKQVKMLDGLIAESPRGGRLFLKNFLEMDDRKKIKMEILNKKTKDKEYKNLLKPMIEGEIWGLISDSGMPMFSDPGEKLVFMARESLIDIEACIGTTSITLALVLSGFSGQNFAYHGYLPIRENLLKRKLKFLEKRAFLEKSTHIWIETPYRYTQMCKTIISTLNDNMYLCVARNLSFPNEEVLVKRIKDWKDERIAKEKSLVVFLISRK